MEQSKVTLLKVVNGFLLFFLLGLIVGCSSKPTKPSGDANDTVSITKDTVAKLSAKEIVAETFGVDLGLSVNWAECNVGASKPQEFGLLTSYGNVDGRITPAPPAVDISGTPHDIARVKLGKPWRMPTYDELLELMSQCTWAHEKYKGVPGMRVTGPNGNSIFLPECGGYIFDESLARQLSKIKNFDPTDCRGSNSDESYYWVGTTKEGLFPFLKIENGGNSYKWMLTIQGCEAYAVRPVADK